MTLPADPPIAGGGGGTPSGEYRTTWDASSGSFPADVEAASDWYNVTVAGTVDGQAFEIGDYLVALVDSPSTTTFAANWSRVPAPGGVTIAEGRDYVTIAGQELTLGAVDLAADVTGTLPEGNGGSGGTVFATQVAATAAVAANTAKVTNATHTGEVTGSGALTVDKTAITGKTLVTAASTDHVLIADASDSDNLKKALVSDVLARGNHTGTQAASTITGLPAEIGVHVSNQTDALTTGTAKVTFRMPFAMTVTDVRASLKTASSSGDPTFDINEGGTTILSTKLSIDANEKTSESAATAAVISDSALADDAEITIDVDTAGTGAVGAVVWLIGTRA